MILIRSDARHLPLADESVQCCVTSPPYWGLRSYHGGESMIGLEPTFEEHLANLVAVFREVRRVLRKDGTVWLNYGDAYTSGNGGQGGQADGGVINKRKRSAPRTSKPKDLMFMPARVALALQADGWWIRSEIIWHKPNPMPESVTDRPTNAHEKVFLLTKSAKYFYDAEAVRVPSKGPSRATFRGGVDGYTGQNGDGVGGGHVEKDAGQSRAMSAANLRNVWTIPTQGVSAAHFATFPERLVEPCILAGTSAEGACAKCGAPWTRVVETKKIPGDMRNREGAKMSYHTRTLGGGQAIQNWREENPSLTTGWKPTCECEAPTVPCTVLDPFVGSGTVCRVATQLNRRGIGCDLGYQDIAVKRTINVQRMLI